MIRVGFFWVCILGSPLALAGAELAEAPPDKSRYHLFKPVPRELMREMSTDRPDQTESPHTVDAGHFQFEMDFVNALFDRDRSEGGDVRTEGWALAPINLKAGLLNNVDLQLMIDPYVHVRARDRVTRTVAEASGFGDVTTRLKINLWGNDSGRTALGIMPFVKWPLSESEVRNGRTEGGVIFPYGIDLGGGWSLGGTSGLEFVAEDSSQYHTQFVNSLTIGRGITEKLGMYAEFFSVVSTARDEPWLGQADVGWTYAITDDVQLDWGCNFGVTRSAPDYNPFVGISVRF